jgi:hypothetical protein
MKLPVLFLFLISVTGSLRSQTVLVHDPVSNMKIFQACEILRANEGEIYESIVQHSNLQKYKDPDNPFNSTCNYDVSSGSLWILIGEGSLYDRSVYRLAGTIYHESLHLLLKLQRQREGRIVNFSDLSAQERKQEEIFIYKKTKELLKKIGTPLWEIQEYDQWLEGAKNKNYF